MLKKINDLWFKLIGSRSDFMLESRIFHSISIGIMVLGAIYVPYNLFAGLYVASLSAFIIALVFWWQYYNSRKHGKPHSTLLVGLTGLLIFSVNYFANSGINGSTDLIWPAYLLLVFAVSPYKQHLLWLGVYLVSFFILHLVAYNYPALVHYPFSAGRGELIDRVTAFPLPVLSIYIIIKYIRKNHDKERAAVAEKARAIDAQNQQILQQKLQLEASNTEKNKLMSIISHDMRAPLISIQNYLELLTEGELDDTQRPVLEKELLKATNSTMDMLSNLLLWSKSQMEGPAVKLLTINLLSAVKSTLEMSRVQAEKKGIFLDYYISPEISVIADADMLQLVVRNLISNAIKFSPQGGVINIDAQVVARECKITVSDNGKGIHPHKQAKIFTAGTEPAYGTQNEKGVGLGLILCKEFIERQGGRIGFESTYGQGSSFFIFMPVSLIVTNQTHVPELALAMPAL